MKNGYRYDILFQISDVNTLKKLLDENPNIADIKMAVIKNKKANKSKLYDICKKFASKDLQFMEEFYQQFHKLSDSDSFQNDLWDYIEKSNYLFDMIKNHYLDIPTSRMKKWLLSENKDVKWIAEKTIKFSKNDSPSEKKASRIARRIARTESIARKIMMTM